MQFAPQEDATHHGNVSQQEDGRSIPGLVGATRHLQLPTLEEKQLLQYFCNYFAKTRSWLPSLRCDEDATFPKTPLLSLPWLRWVSATLLSSHSFAFSQWKIAFFPLENFNFNKTIIFGRAASGEEGGRWHRGAHLLLGELSQEEKLRKSHHRQLQPSLA